ncbi:MAG: hypothetical protein ACLSAC_17455 [Enterocloster bolteae]
MRFLGQAGRKRRRKRVIGSTCEFMELEDGSGIVHVACSMKAGAPTPDVVELVRAYIGTRWVGAQPVIQARLRAVEVTINGIIRAAGRGGYGKCPRRAGGVIALELYGGRKQ